MLFQAFLTTNPKCTGFCRIFVTGMPAQNAMIELYCMLWSRPIVLATTLPNINKDRWVLGLQGSVAKILQNPVQYNNYGAIWDSTKDSAKPFTV